MQVKVFFNNSCNICKMEIDHYKKHSDNSLDWIDITNNDEEISLFKEEMQILKDEVKLIAGVNRDMKVDMKTDIRRIEKIVEDTETRVKEDSREFSRDMKELKIDLDKKIKRALENPLTNMNR